MRALRLCTAALMLILTSLVDATVPTSIVVQGRLSDSTGAPLPSGAKTFVFRIFDAAVGGNEIWPGGAGEIQILNTDASGLWIALVGASSPLSAPVFADSLRWLGISVDGTPLPRVRLAAGAYAHRVASIDGATGGTIEGNTGILQDNPTSVLSVNGSFATRVRYTAANTTLDGNDQFVVATVNGITLTLPPAASCPGRHYFIKNLVPGDSQVSVVVSPGSGDLIDGNPSLVLTVQFMSYSFVSDGVSHWLIID